MVGGLGAWPPPVIRAAVSASQDQVHGEIHWPQQADVFLPIFCREKWLIGVGTQTLVQTTPGRIPQNSLDWTGFDVRLKYISVGHSRCIHLSSVNAPRPTGPGDKVSAGPA